MKNRGLQSLAKKEFAQHLKYLKGENQIKHDDLAFLEVHK
jgi:hypothetical protein